MDASVVHNLAALEYQRRRRRTARPEVRRCGAPDVGVVVSGALRRSAWVVLIVTIAVVATYNMRDDGGATVIPRIIAGVGAVVLVAMSIPVLRNVPGSMLTSVVRQRQILVLRILQLLAAVVLGVVTAAVGAMTVPGVAASFLLLSVLVGGITDERLW